MNLFPLVEGSLENFGLGTPAPMRVRGSGRGGERAKTGQSGVKSGVSDCAARRLGPEDGKGKREAVYSPAKTVPGIPSPPEPSSFSTPASMAWDAGLPQM